jgi:peptide/nickel transport system substrate-binding protein
MIKRLIATGVCLAALVAAAVPATAEKITVGTKWELTTLDPHFFNGFPSASSHPYIYDKLINTDANVNLRPGLALSWKPIGKTTWEFKLRKGVKFHDGSDFDAADVVATFNRIPKVPNSPNSFNQFIRAIVETKVIDPHTIHLITDAPAPVLPVDLSNVHIISDKYENASTDDFNRADAAVGTGPFTVVEWKRGEGLKLKRFEGYWEGPSVWSEVHERVLAKDSPRVAAFLAGEVDVIDYVPVQDVQRMRKDPKIEVFQGPVGRIHYIGMDSLRDVSPFVSAKDGSKLPKNPLKDARVRKALSLALNRELLIGKLLDGVGEPAAQFLPSSFPGASSKLKPDAHDPAGAKKLLAEAGYKDGFALTLHATNGRYPADKELAQAIGQMWARIGLKISVEAISRTIFFPKATKHEFSVYTAQYGSTEMTRQLSSLIYTRGISKGKGNGNRARYSNKAVDAAIDAARVELDPAKRAAHLARANELCVADMGYIPLYHPGLIFAARKGIQVEVRADGHGNAFQQYTPGKK